MIATSLVRQVAFRMHTPQWARLPTSGAGAAKAGGRLNRIGTEALYLAFDAETAIGEYQQLSALLPPGTLVSYQVTLNKVVDFSAGYTPEWDPLWHDFFCDWRQIWLRDRVEPPTWVLGDMCLEAGYKGVIFPSTIIRGGRNLVVYTSALQTGDLLEVYDPQQHLPKDGSSWE